MSVPILDPVTALYILQTSLELAHSKMIEMLSSERFLTGWNGIRDIIIRERFGRP